MWVQLFIVIIKYDQMFPLICNIWINEKKLRHIWLFRDRLKPFNRKSEIMLF